MLGVPKDCARGENVTRERPRPWKKHEEKTRSLSNRERSRYVTLPLYKQNKKTKQMTCIQSFLCMIALRSKTVAHTFFLSFDNGNGRLCQDPAILLP